MILLNFIGLAMMIVGYHNENGLTFVLGLGLIVLCLFSQCIIVLGDEE